MQKVFAVLLSEFRKLGATIVFANFSKVILDTRKSDLLAAQAYCHSLLKTLQTRFVSLMQEIKKKKTATSTSVFLFIYLLSTTGVF